MFILTEKELEDIIKDFMLTVALENRGKKSINEISKRINQIFDVKQWQLENKKLVRFGDIEKSNY